MWIVVAKLDITEHLLKHLAQNCQTALSTIKGMFYLSNKQIFTHHTMHA